MTFPEDLLPILLVIVSSYLIGSLPTAYLIARTRNINIFEVGSGNMGGTNVARSIGFYWGVLTLLIDISKGMCAVFLARTIMPGHLWTVTTISAIVAIIGHNWSLFATLLYMAFARDEEGNRPKKLSIRGGKGAATAFGTLVMIAPATTIIVMLAFSITIVLGTRLVSLAVLSGFALAIIWLVILVGQELMPHEILIYSIAVAILLIYRFRGNIQRLLTGTERRLGETV